MNYKELENGKYELTLKEGICIRDVLSGGEITFSQGKTYILTVKDGTYSIWDDFHTEEQVSLNYPLLEYFNVRRI